MKELKFIQLQKGSEEHYNLFEKELSSCPTI
jgi:hypothetical protein